MPRFLSAMVIALSVGLAAKAGDKPNIVFIISDDQHWQDYGFMGHPIIQTPHLDRLTKESLVYPRGYVPSSLCRPSLATMITGLQPHQHKVTSNDPPIPEGVKPAAARKHPEFLKNREAMIAEFEKSPSLPQLLAKAGYVSHQSGKWWEGNACRCGGFTEGMTHGDPDKGGRHGDEGLKIGREGMKPILEFIDESQKADKPFFVWYAPFMPHTPHNPPERLLNKYRDKTPSLFIARYWAMCDWFDETIGELLDHLDDNKLSDNTIVIFVCDNGWIQQDNAPGFAERSKRSQYDGGIRTPITIRWPGKVKPGRSDALAHTIDMAPTVLLAAGLKPTDDMAGLDLTKPELLAKRDELFGSIFLHNAIDVTDPAANLEYRWIIRGKWKLIVPDQVNVPDGQVELFDLIADPHEKDNLAAKHPERVAELRRRLDKWWTPARKTTE